MPIFHPFELAGVVFRFISCTEQLLIIINFVNYLGLHS